MSISQDAHKEKRKGFAKSKKRYYLKSRYGITVDEYNTIMESPCEICGDKSEHLDHCHLTGKVRGPLCQYCNHGLGRFRDNPDILRAAILYLERHKA